MKLIRFILLLSLCIPAFGKRLPDDYWHDIRVTKNTPITPYTKFAKPYAQGKLKVFFIMPFVSTAREAAEIWQRLDIEIFGETAIQTDKLVVEYGCFPDILDTTEELQYKILKKVKGGAGLVSFYCEDVPAEVFKNRLPETEDEIFQGVPFSGLLYCVDLAKQLKVPIEELAHRIIAVYEFGNGRIVKIDYHRKVDIKPCSGGPGVTPPIPYTFEAETFYDYHIALVLRAILWAAKKIPQFKFKSEFEKPILFEDLPSPNWNFGVLIVISFTIPCCGLWRL